MDHGHLVHLAPGTAITAGCGALQGLRKGLVPIEPAEQAAVVGAHQLGQCPPKLVLRQHAGAHTGQCIAGDRRQARALQQHCRQRPAPNRVGRSGWRVSGEPGVPAGNQGLQPTGLTGLCRQIAQSLLKQGRRQAVHIGMEVLHVVQGCGGQGRQPRLDPAGPVRRVAIGAEIQAITRLLIDKAVVGRHQIATRWVDAARHVGPGNLAVPVVGASPAGHRQPAVQARPMRHHGAHQMADLALRVRRHQVVVDQAPAAGGIKQYLHAARVQHAGQAIKRQVGLRKLH